MECSLCCRKQEEVIFKTENFYVTPSLGQIVGGYLLICTNQHLIGLSQISPEQFFELKQVQARVRELLTQNYTSPLFFEHGIVESSKRAGCCVEHAHLHAVPVNFDIYEDISRSFPAKRILDISELAGQQESKTAYLYYENQRQEKYLFPLKEAIPSQLIRKIIAARLGIPDKWDWRQHPELQRFNQTLKRIREWQAGEYQTG